MKYLVFMIENLKMLHENYSGILSRCNVFPVHI